MTIAEKDNPNIMITYDFKGDISALMALSKASNVATSTCVWNGIFDAERALKEHMVDHLQKAGLLEENAQEIVDEISAVIDWIKWES